MSNYVNWLRGDYFARHLLGASATNVDITEINRDREQTGSTTGGRGGRGGGSN